MLLLFFVLFRTVCGAPIEITIENHVLEIDNDILKSIKPIEGPSYDLNLSGLGLRGIDNHVFDDLGHVLNLNLDNNNLTILPDLLFSNLTGLEHISLADNAIDTITKPFVHLNNLKTLNISNNRIQDLGRGCFCGLTSEADIFTHGVNLFSMEIGIFENPNPRIDSQEVEQLDEVQSQSDSKSKKVKPTNARKVGNFDLSFGWDQKWKVRLCSNQGIVTKLEVTDPDGLSEFGCQEVYTLNGIVFLLKLGITGFQRGWYRLQAYPIRALDFKNNDIVDLSAEMLNDLPARVVTVNLINNKIKKLAKGKIVNEHLRRLILLNNSISEIEDGALANTNIVDLYLKRNKLNNTRFVATLPDTIREMDLSENHIKELSAGSFSSHKALINLNLDENKISEITRESLEGLSSLSKLSMQYNNLKNIESGSFDNLQALSALNLRWNNLTSLDKGVFTGLNSLKLINIEYNQLSKLTSDSFYGLPDTLRELNVDHNQIETLEIGTFVNVPKIILSLEYNKISKIEKGTFNSPNLTELYLANNLLSKPDGDSFEGLGNLKYLSLDGNGIAKIEKGFAKNLGGLLGLSLSNNPITRLENGDLFGLRTAAGSWIRLVDVPVKVIQGGLFKDM